MDIAVSYRLTEDGPIWHWEVQRGGRLLASGTERSVVGARVQALLRGARLVREGVAPSASGKTPQ